MRLKNILIVVKNIEESKKFYHDLFGLDVILDSDGNVILTEGLVLQEEKVWKNHLQLDVTHNSNSSMLYFEENNIDDFVAKLEKLYPSIQYINKLTEQNDVRKMVRFYDLDGNLIEVGGKCEK